MDVGGRSEDDFIAPGEGDGEGGGGILKRKSAAARTRGAGGGWSGRDGSQGAWGVNTWHSGFMTAFRRGFEIVEGEV